MSAHTGVWYIDEWDSLSPDQRRDYFPFHPMSEKFAVMAKEPKPKPAIDWDALLLDAITTIEVISGDDSYAPSARRTLKRLREVRASLRGAT